MRPCVGTSLHRRLLNPPIRKVPRSGPLRIASVISKSAGSSISSVAKYSFNDSKKIILPWSRFIILQNFLHLIGFIFSIKSKKEPSDNRGGLANRSFWLTSWVDSKMHERKFSRSSCTKNSILLLSPNLNCRRFLFVLSPLEMSKSCVPPFWPKALEPYLKALAA